MRNPRFLKIRSRTSRAAQAAQRSRSRTRKCTFARIGSGWDTRQTKTMSDRLNVRRAWGTRLAGLLSMVVCLGVVIVSVVQERRPVDPAVFAEAEVTLKLAASEISVPTGDPLNEAVAEVRTPLVSYLVRELITKRLGSTQLSADFEIGGPRDDSPGDRVDPNVGRRSPILVEAHPRMPSLKPRLKSRTSVHASGTIGDGAAARDQGIVVSRNDTAIQASSLDVGVRNSKATTVQATSTTPDSRMRPAVALAPIPVASNIAVPDESHGTNGSAGPPQGYDRMGLIEAAARLADGLRAMREEALSQGEERVFVVDVEDRVVSASSTAASVRLDPAFNIRLHTAKSELAGKSRGGIRFYADGSSTGGRIELELLGEHAAISVQWATGAVTVER